jgi:hypothetical protein
MLKRIIGPIKGPHFVIASGSFYFKREKDVTATPVPIFIQNSLLQ